MIVRFKTTTVRPGSVVTVRTDADDWKADIPGLYEADEWRFTVPDPTPGNPLEFKLLLDGARWMQGDNFRREAGNQADFVCDDTQVVFERRDYIRVENSYVQRLFFQPNLDGEREYDAIVIGSGIGGGILADELSDLGQDVLVLEAGGLLFPTHAGNLPRQHWVGNFDKHIWGLWEELGIQNFDKAPGTTFVGGQAFNLGGRSIFWGGLIPKMARWELEAWPRAVRDDLESVGYERAEGVMNRIPVTPSDYHRRIRRLLSTEIPELNYFDAPMALQASTLDRGRIPTGLFSTADLLMESMLTASEMGRQGLTINLNHLVTGLVPSGGKIGEVMAWDMVARQERSFKGKRVVLAAGTIESAKIALMSKLADPSGKIGAGITDHPIFFTHFAIPPTSPHHDALGACKLLAAHKDASATSHPYNLVLELGADLNQGRYVDPDILAEHRRKKGDYMLCEVVFLFNAPLVKENRVTHTGGFEDRPVLTMQPCPLDGSLRDEVNGLKDRVIQLLGGESLDDEDLSLRLALLGGVSHEVGSLRMGDDQDGVVDTNLKFHAYDNLYACDLSVFPTSPAANPTLTLAALAIRLAQHLKALP